MAEIRQAQDRWAEAAGHWAEVAKIRELEPTGLQRLAAAEIKLGKTKAAVATLEKLLAREWPSRFGNVHDEARRKLVALKKSS